MSEELIITEHEAIERGVIDCRCVYCVAYRRTRDASTLALPLATAKEAVLRAAVEWARHENAVRERVGIERPLEVGELDALLKAHQEASFALSAAVDATKAIEGEVARNGR